MRIGERLSAETKEKLGVPKKKKEYSQREIEQLMNTNAQTYKRVNGRIRRK